MQYEGVVYRPPSEAYSLIIQVTLGCSHNKCTFCNMFKDKKFRIRKLEDIFHDLEEARTHYHSVKRVFLIDGDALVLKTEHLEKILIRIRELFPECERVGLSSTSKDILRKSDDDLIKLRDLGLKIIYLGVETGSNNILKDIKKGVTADEIMEAGKKVRRNGIKLSVSLISGLGGKEKWEEHALETAKVINAINPEYIGLLTLIVEPNTELANTVKKGEMTLLSPKEVLIETRKFVENLDLRHSIFSGNHASNYIPLSATLPEQKELLLKQIDALIEKNDDFKENSYRRL